MHNLYRWPSKDASYQALINLAKQFQRRRFSRNQPIRNKNCLWRPCLLTDRDEMSNLYRGPAIDVSYQVSVHLAKRLQRRRFYRNQPIRNKNSVAAMFDSGSELNEQSLQRIFQGCFSPSFDSIGPAVSEETIFLEINQSETRIACGGHVFNGWEINEQSL